MREPGLSLRYFNKEWLNYLFEITDDAHSKQGLHKELSLKLYCHFKVILLAFRHLANVTVWKLANLPGTLGDQSSAKPSVM